MNDSVSVLFTEEQIDKRIREMGSRISRDFEGEEITLVCILKGASFFACELAKRITIPVYMEFMSVSSYGNAASSSGDVKLINDLTGCVEGKNVLIAEDIIDSGRTLDYLINSFKDRGAKTVKICALLSKPSRRVIDVTADYLGYEIPDKFVVGYGLDYAQRYRNLPYIGVIDTEQADI